MPPSKRRAEDMSEGLLAVAVAAEQAEIVEQKSASDELDVETVYGEYIDVLRSEYLQDDMDHSSHYIFMLASALLMWLLRSRLGFVMRFIRSSAVGRDAKMNMNQALLSFGPRGGNKSKDRLLAEHIFRLERIRCGFGHYIYSHHHWNFRDRKTLRRPRTALELVELLLRLYNMGASHHHATRLVIVRACEQLRLLVVQAWALTPEQQRGREGIDIDTRIDEACDPAIHILREIVNFEGETTPAPAAATPAPTRSRIATDAPSSTPIPTELAAAISLALQNTHGLNLLVAAISHKLS